MTMKRTYLLENRDQAWEFMRACDDAQVMAGFPALGIPAVQVATERDIEATRLEQILRAFPSARLLTSQ
jgi:hypothetical protein